MVDGKTVACIEARGHEIRVQEASYFLVKSNHQVMFESDNDPASSNSQSCLTSARNRMASVGELDDILTVLCSHDDGDTGVCNHLKGRRTVYSYVLNFLGDKISLHVSKELPCRAEHFRKLDLPLAEMWNAEDLSNSTRRIRDSGIKARELSITNRILPVQTICEVSRFCTETSCPVSPGMGVMRSNTWMT